MQFGICPDLKKTSSTILPSQPPKEISLTTKKMIAASAALAVLSIPRVRRAIPAVVGLTAGVMFSPHSLQRPIKFS